MTGTPVIALTMGEPAGVAPEITAMAWAALASEGNCCFALIGDATYWQARAGHLASFKVITDLAEIPSVFPAAVPVLHRPLPASPRAGHVEPDTARAVIEAIDDAVDLVLGGKAAAIVTNPIQKESLYAAGFQHQGHTDYLAHLARQHGHVASEVMMLVAKDLRAVPVTVHIPLKEVPASLSTATIITQARVVARSLSTQFGISRPRLAVTGLNPHAGENGAMGREEIEIVGPAIRQLAAEGFEVLGPLPADTAFHEEARALYDAILCMYHDQALIPVKTLDFHGGVNVTLGLPFIRTSPDHGTALDIAGTGRANPRSLIAALRLATRMARHGGR